MKKYLSILMATLGVCLLGIPLTVSATFIEAETASSLNPTSGQIKVEGGDRLGFVHHNNTATYNQKDLYNPVQFVARVSSPNGGMIEIRDGSSTGPLIGECVVEPTGGWWSWETVSCSVSNAYSNTNGTYDIVLVFKDTGPDPYVCNLDWFEFVSETFYIEAEDATSKHQWINVTQGTSDVGGGEQVSNVKRNRWTAYAGICFAGHDTFKARISSVASGSQIEVRLGSQTGTLVGTLDIPNTGWWHTWVDVEGSLSTPINGEHDLYLVYKNANVSGYLLNLNWFEFSKSEPNINVYPAVPNSNNAEFKSKYYKFSIQELSKLNNSSKAQATNWETAFPWFTKCQEADYKPANWTWYTQSYAPLTQWNAGQPVNAYFSQQIANWSHTFCNFEMKPNTPVVIKIERLNPSGFNGGPVALSDASDITVHPASAGATVEVIGGDVYVTMSNPAQITVDFENSGDRGLNYRDAPQSNPSMGYNKTYPYTNEMNAHHAVSIFANPFIIGKPELSDPTVHYVQPGAAIPATGGAWDTLYFMPGIHKLSVDSNGNEREWRPSDVVSLESGRNYYIPGDAIVYGNFKDESGPRYGHPIDDVRVFGHGTISGVKIHHFNDWSSALTNDSNMDIADKYLNQGLLLNQGVRRVEHKYLRVVELLDAMNCTVEGLTVIDQPEHGIYLHGREEIGSSNYLKWLKQITWRVNTDGMGPKGNTYLENCFIRHQDDGIYVGGMGISNVVFWSDVNGTSLRISDIAHDRGTNWPTGLDGDLIVEDIDFIYTRGGAFGFGGGLIATGSYPHEGPRGPKMDNNGNINTLYHTGQYVVFKNMTVEDPRPVRSLFDVDLRKPDSSGFTAAQFKGLKFENIDYQYANMTGRVNKLLSRPNYGVHLKNWTFDYVTIDGNDLDLNYMQNTSNFIFEDIGDTNNPGPMVNPSSMTFL